MKLHYGYSFAIPGEPKCPIVRGDRLPNKVGPERSRHFTKEKCQVTCKHCLKKVEFLLDRRDKRSIEKAA